MLFQT